MVTPVCSPAPLSSASGSRRTVRELHILAHALVRLLVESGFASVAIEGDHAASKALDAFVARGVGDPGTTLRESRPFLATRELLDLVLWLRRHNAHDRARAVHIVHGGTDDLTSPAALERSLAQEDRGGRVVPDT
jgi:erythromycin esterase-like protein